MASSFACGWVPIPAKLPERTQVLWALASTAPPESALPPMEGRCCCPRHWRRCWSIRFLMATPLEDLGEHLLKDLVRPQHLFQLRAAICSPNFRHAFARELGGSGPSSLTADQLRRARARERSPPWVAQGWWRHNPSVQLPRVRAVDDQSAYPHGKAYPTGGAAT